MAENTQLPLLSFGYGAEANLPSKHTQGKIYITTDKHRMYVDLPGVNDRLCLNNFELVEGNLPSPGIAGQFYVKKVTTGSGNEAVTTYSLHCYDGNDWKEIINVVDLENAIANLEDRMDEVEGRLNTYDSDWAELPETYVAKSGDTMTGNLAMSGKNITHLASGGTTETNAANIGDVNSAVSTHAAVKATGTVLGHVTLSDAVNGEQDADDGVAATPKAVAEAYALAENAKSLAEGIDVSPFVKKDGTVAMEANLNLGTHKLINVVDPVADQDAATKKYVDTLIGTDADADTVTGRVKVLEDSLGEAVANDAGKADGTAYERIAKNASDIAAHDSRLTDVEGIAGSAVQPGELDAYVKLNSLTQQIIQSSISVNPSSTSDPRTGVVFATTGQLLLPNDPVKEGYTTTGREAVRISYLNNRLGTITDAIEDEIALRQSADEALDARIQPIEDVIDGITGAMHFIGVSSTNPIPVDGDTNSGKVTVDGTEITTFKNGDVVVYSTKEYVYSNNAWVELGDVTAEAQRIEDLEEIINDANTGLLARMTAAEGEIDVLQSDVMDIQGNISSEIEPAIDALKSIVGNDANGSDPDWPGYEPATGLIGDVRDLQDRVDTAEDIIGTEPVPAVGEPGDPDYKEAEDGTGLIGDVRNLQALTETQSSAIVGLGNQLTWTSF